MAGLITRIRNKLRSRAVFSFWDRAIQNAEHQPKSQLRALSKDATRLSKTLDRFQKLGNSRLDPVPAQPLPSGVDWALRPDVFTKSANPTGHAPLTNQTQLSDNVTSFCDDPDAQIALRQRQLKAGKFELILDIYELGGSYFSLAIGLGEAAAREMTKDDLVRVKLECTAEQDSEIMLRLNLRSGPNTEQVLRPYRPGGQVEFDLFYVDFDPKRMSDAWLDIILPPQRLNQIILRDIVITRQSRAEI